MLGHYKVNSENRAHIVLKLLVFVAFETWDFKCHGLFARNVGKNSVCVIKAILNH